MTYQTPIIMRSGDHSEYCKCRECMGNAPQHEQDADCTVDPETLICTTCLVDHSDPCPDCNGRGFHKLTCFWMSPAMLTEVNA